MDIIELKVDYKKAGLEPSDMQPTLTCVIPPKSEEMGKRGRGALLICPGGGYDYCSDREAETVAYRFSGAGYACFGSKVYSRERRTAGHRPEQDIRAWLLCRRTPCRKHGEPLVKQRTYGHAGL